MIVDGDVLIERLKHVDPFGRPICSLVFFYSPTCVFSSRVAGYVYSLAHLFPKLRVYALNVDNKAPSTEQLINQHGVAATPVLFLFENHVARVRMHDDSGSFRLLVELLLKRTDLRLPPTIKRDDLNRIGNASNENAEHFVEYREFIANFFQFADMSDGIDRYYILANVILLLNVVYFVFIGPRLSQWFPANQRSTASSPAAKQRARSFRRVLAQKEERGGRPGGFFESAAHSPARRSDAPRQAAGSTERDDVEIDWGSPECGAYEEVTATHEVEESNGELDRFGRETRKIARPTLRNVESPKKNPLTPIALPPSTCMRTMSIEQQRMIVINQRRKLEVHKPKPRWKTLSDLMAAAESIPLPSDKPLPVLSSEPLLLYYRDLIRPTAGKEMRDLREQIQRYRKREHRHAKKLKGESAGALTLKTYGDLSNEGRRKLCKRLRENVHESLKFCSEEVRVGEKLNLEQTWAFMTEFGLTDGVLDKYRTFLNKFHANPFVSRRQTGDHRRKLKQDELNDGAVGQRSGGRARGQSPRPKTKSRPPSSLESFRGRAKPQSRKDEAPAPKRRRREARPAGGDE
ncbi:hypothetical protein M3Y99_00178400 [Aphelenchoides fujianensis]|nr:hypothetical protein M3Y99_00178400 [Aphelenchoides fujianensis]